VREYAELRLQFERGGDAGALFRVHASGAGGEAWGEFEVPFSELELENFVLKVGGRRRVSRRVDSPEMDLVRRFGQGLFESVFQARVRDVYRTSVSAARNEGKGLRISLSLAGTPELMDLPWEFLYDDPRFLSVSTWTPVVRYLDLPFERRPLTVTLPLRILAMISLPAEAVRLDVDEERRKLERGLRELVEADSVEITWLEEATLRALQRGLRRAEYHVFHFIGHAGYDSRLEDGVLLLEDESEGGRLVTGERLGTILNDHMSLRLAVLNACEGARTSPRDPFSGVAASLVQREIPAVVAMQFEITDRAAIVFAEEFYAAIADGYPVDSAVAEARKAILADDNEVEWGTPVLFMRVPDGRIFDVAAAAAHHVQVHAPEPDTGPATPSVAASSPPAPPLREPSAERMPPTEAPARAGGSGGFWTRWGVRTKVLVVAATLALVLVPVVVVLARTGGEEASGPPRLVSFSTEPDGKGCLATWELEGTGENDLVALYETSTAWLSEPVDPGRGEYLRADGAIDLIKHYPSETAAAAGAHDRTWSPTSPGC
jgi:hypothetical protein